MIENIKPYTREEVEAAGDAFPTRGPICPKCKTHIPHFKDLAEEVEHRLHDLIRGDRKMAAIAELRHATGCSLRWAKIWVVHDGRPDSVGTTAPCPYCGKPLKTARARQCPHCNMDWHDPEHPKRLGAAEHAGGN